MRRYFRQSWHSGSLPNTDRFFADSAKAALVAEPILGTRVIIEPQLDKTCAMQELPFVPAIYLQKLVELMWEENLPVDHLLRECSIDPSYLRHPQMYLSAYQSQAVIQKFIDLSTRSNLGVRYGLRLDLLTHGLFGYACMFRGHFRELMDHILAYMKVRLPLLQLSIRHEQEYFAVGVDFPILQQDVRTFVIQAYLTSFYNLGSMVAPNTVIHTCEAIFDQSRSLQVLLPASIESGQPRNEVRFYIGEKPATQAQTAKSGEVEEMDLPSIVLRLRQLVLCHADKLLSAEDAASHLGMSVRTLRRRLSENGYSFRNIRLEMCMGSAMRLLQSSNISIERIAEMYGYSDQPSFSRAFQKWAGEPPNAARQRAQRPIDGEDCDTAA